MLKPLEPVPHLEVKTLTGNIWKISERKPENFSMVVFYHGLHCPVCKVYLEKLAADLEEYENIGVDIICVSVNDKEFAQRTLDEWNLGNLRLGYDLDIETGRNWGVYISKASKDSEPEMFFEPAIFLIRPDGILYSASVQSMQFARPLSSELLKTIRFIVKEKYPPRGTE